ncbi:MAG TPA: phosphatidylserine decarboxylase family protein [Methylomirabilota bacterium]|nr:phosphatidylserine decarboxylase family protein [Methylomirabilota bacterium]
MPERLLPIAPEGWPFILVPLGVALALVLGGWTRVAALIAVVAAFMAFFFRDPERVAPAVSGAILAPADGRVVDVRAVVADPFVGAAWRVSIFLSPLDVHVNRAPIGGLVAEVQYRPGRRAAAYRSEASELNERTSVALQGETARVVVRQIAGVLARRIVCRVRPGDKLVAGQRFGLIKFGSRTDLIVPASARLRVVVGDHVRGGETVVGVLS